MQNGPYQDSPILNEIHTRFPALLYNPNQFESLNSVFMYVQEQMRNRYDVFSREQQRYDDVRPRQPRQPRQQRQPRHSRQQAQPVPVDYVYQTPQPIRPVYTPPQRRTGPVFTPQQRPPVYIPPPRPTAPVVVRSADINSLLETADLNRIFLADLNRLFLGGIGANFMDPVVVAPTAAQLEQGSTLHTTIADSETPCTVCQDNIGTGETIRRLNHCNHAFHRNCIDTWYQRNVHCPVCRHDIRL